MKIERRSKALRFKAGVDAQGRKTLKGFASTFEPPENHDSHGEIIGERAYDDFVKAFAAGEAQLLMMDHHDMTKPVGRWTVAEVREVDGKKGLWVEGYLTRASDGQDMALKIEDEVVTGLSVHFDAFEKDAQVLEQKTPWGAPVVQWNKVRPFEVSPVGIGSNHEALISSYKSRDGGRTHRRALRAPRRKGSHAKGMALRQVIAAALYDNGGQEGHLPDPWELAWEVAYQTNLSTSTVLDVMGGMIEPREEHLAAIASVTGASLESLQSALASDMGGDPPAAEDTVTIEEAKADEPVDEAKGAMLGMKLTERIAEILEDEPDVEREEIIEALVDATELDAGTVEAVIAGEELEVSLDHVVTMAEVLGMDVAFLVKGALEDGLMYEGLDVDMSEEEIAEALAMMDSEADEADVAQAKMFGSFARLRRALQG